MRFKEHKIEGAPGEVEIIIKMLKYGDTIMMCSLKVLYNKCLTERPLSEEWNNFLLLLFK